MVKLKVSPLTKVLLPILTVALAIWVSSASLRMIVLSITVAVAFSVYAKLAPALYTGVSFTAVKLMVEVTPVEVCAPTLSELASVTAHVMVRLALV